MMGDRTVIKLEKLRKFESMAALSAILILEANLYVGLSAELEKYLDSPSEDTLSSIKAVLTECNNRYPAFIEAQTQQISLLLEAGFLRGAVHKTTPTPQDAPPILPVENIGDNNIIPLFGTVTGNIPPKLPEQSSSDSSDSNNIIQLFPRKK